MSQGICTPTSALTPAQRGALGRKEPLTAFIINHPLIPIPVPQQLHPLQPPQHSAHISPLFEIPRVHTNQPLPPLLIPFRSNLRRNPKLVFRRPLGHLRPDTIHIRTPNKKHPLPRRAARPLRRAQDIRLQLPTQGRDLARDRTFTVAARHNRSLDLGPCGSKGVEVAVRCLGEPGPVFGQGPLRVGRVCDADPVVVAEVGRQGRGGWEAGEEVWDRLGELSAGELAFVGVEGLDGRGGGFCWGVGYFGAGAGCYGGELVRVGRPVGGGIVVVGALGESGAEFVVAWWDWDLFHDCRLRTCVGHTVEA